VEAPVEESCGAGEPEVEKAATMRQTEITGLGIQVPLINILLTI